jgi:hypothetical protein
VILALVLVSASAGGEVEIRYEGVQHDARGVWLVHRGKVAYVCVDRPQLQLQLQALSQCGWISCRYSYTYSQWLIGLAD